MDIDKETYEKIYRRGYHAGYQAGRSAHLRDRKGGSGRPNRYQFHSLKAGASMPVVGAEPTKVYNAARRWAQRNAPGRRFTVRPEDFGCTITRTS